MQTVHFVVSSNCTAVDNDNRLCSKKKQRLQFLVNIKNAAFYPETTRATHRELRCCVSVIIIAEACLIQINTYMSGLTGRVI